MITKPNINLYRGDVFDVIKTIPDKTVDLIFADPPYNLSGANFLTVKSGRPVVCNKGQWDIIDDLQMFNRNWLTECRRVLSDNGTLWISGTLHNHPSIGVLLKELSFWIINDIIWYKPNAAPLMSQNRFAPCCELIWLASKTKKYFFNYEKAKELNGGKQMKTLWQMTAERHKTVHPTEKPEKLLERILSIGSEEGFTVLDPFMGSGTTGVVAKRMGCNFIGIEIDQEFFYIAQNRIAKTLSPIEMELASLF